MIRALSGFEVMPAQSYSANGANGSDKVFSTLLGQIGKSGAGELSQQTLQGIFKDVAEGKLSPDQAVQLIEAGGENSSQGSVSFSDNADMVQGLLQDVADGKIDAQTGADLAASVMQGGSTQVSGIGNSHSGPILLELLQGVASGEISPQTATQLVGVMGEDGGPIASYGAGNSRSGQFVAGLLHDVAIGKTSPDQAAQFIEAVQPVDQTPD